jgi:hypothetical protein
MATSTRLVTPYRFSLGTIQLTPTSWVKVKQGEELITILNNDLDRNSPVLALPIRSPLVNSTLSYSIERTTNPMSHPLPHVGHQQPLNVVDSLKKL